MSRGDSDCHALVGNPRIDDPLEEAGGVAVAVYRYRKSTRKFADSGPIGEYEGVHTIMTQGTPKSEGVAWVILNGDRVLLAIEEGFEVEQDGEYLDVKPKR